MSILSWLFFESIYGGIALAGLVYLLVRRPGSRRGEIAAAIVFLICALTLPSYPRYQFERQTIAALDKPWVKTVETVNWGDVAEPLTWFFAPAGFFKAAMPDQITEGVFRVVVFRYEEEGMTYLAETQCDSKSFYMALPKSDEKGVPFVNILGEETGFDYVVKDGVTVKHPMTDAEYKAFCEYNWTNERKALANK